MRHKLLDKMQTPAKDGPSDSEWFQQYQQHKLSSNETKVPKPISLQVTQRRRRNW